MLSQAKQEGSSQAVFAAVSRRAKLGVTLVLRSEYNVAKLKRFDLVPAGPMHGPVLLARRAFAEGIERYGPRPGVPDAANRAIVGKEIRMRIADGAEGLVRPGAQGLEVGVELFEKGVDAGAAGFRHMDMYQSKTMRNGNQINFPKGCLPGESVIGTPR